MGKGDKDARVYKRYQKAEVQKVNHLNEDVDRWVCYSYRKRLYTFAFDYRFLALSIGFFKKYIDANHPKHPETAKKCLPGGPASVQLFCCLASPLPACFAKVITRKC
jgi:hypothetical protein